MENLFFPKDSVLFARVLHDDMIIKVFTLVLKNRTMYAKRLTVIRKTFGDRRECVQTCIYASYLFFNGIL